MVDKKYHNQKRLEYIKEIRKTHSESVFIHPLAHIHGYYVDLGEDVNVGSFAVIGEPGVSFPIPVAFITIL